MNTKLNALPRMIATFLVGSAVLMGTAKAQIFSHSRDVVIEQPTNLPDLAQAPGAAFDLYTESGDGNAYLYIEQPNGARLAVFDVTDPGHMKMVRAVTLSVPGPFDFAQHIGDNAVLIRFRNNQSIALLDLHRAKAPVIRPVNGAEFAGRVEPLDPSTYLMIGDAVFSHERASHDYRVIDTSQPASPIVLYTARLVTASITRGETGTTFLLGVDGLTIIRHPQMEDEYAAEQRASN